MKLPYFHLGEACDYDGEVIMAYELMRLLEEAEAAPVIDSTEFADD